MFDIFIGFENRLILIQYFPVSPFAKRHGLPYFIVFIKHKNGINNFVKISFNEYIDRVICTTDDGARFGQFGEIKRGRNKKAEDQQNDQRQKSIDFKDLLLDTVFLRRYPVTDKTPFAGSFVTAGFGVEWLPAPLPPFAGNDPEKEQNFQEHADLVRQGGLRLRFCRRFGPGLLMTQKVGKDLLGRRFILGSDHDHFPVEEPDLRTDIQRPEMIVLNVKGNIRPFKKPLDQGQFDFIVGRMEIYQHDFPRSEQKKHPSSVEKMSAPPG
jgi:hypothetical protein